MKNNDDVRPTGPVSRESHKNKLPPNLNGEVKEFLEKFDLMDQCIDWGRDLKLQDLYIHVEVNPRDGVTAIDTRYRSFPKPETGKLLKMERGTTVTEVIARILLEHYVAMLMD